MRTIYIRTIPAVLLILLTGCRGLPNERKEQETNITSSRSSEFRTALRNEHFQEAEEILAELVAQGSKEAAGLSAELNEARRKSAITRAQNDFRSSALDEVEKRFILPDSYGKTLTVEADSEPSKIPEGKMEKLCRNKISMRLEKAGVKELVWTLSQIDGLNIIADESLSGSKKHMSISVKNVPLKEVLDYISRNMDLTFHLGENVIWVSDASSQKSGSPEQEIQIYPLRKGIIPSSGGKKKEADTELEDALSKLLKNSSDGAFFKIYKDRNLLVIRDTRANLRNVEKLLTVLDSPPKQVLIESRFITISQGDLHSLGLSLQNLIIPKKGSKATFNDLTDRTSTVNFKNGKIDGAVTETEPIPDGLAERRLQAAGELPGQLLLSGILGNVTFQAVLNALDQAQSSETLSAPRITVANNRTASIHRGEKRYYFEDFDIKTIDAGDTGVRTQLVPVGNPKELDLGYKLNVSVSIGNDGETVMLHLEPEITEFIDWDQIFGTNVRLPRVATNTVSTTVVVASGETVVLGGTITQSKTKSRKRIPILSDVPYIGKIFRQNESDQRPQHLLIFVTAKIISPSGEYLEYN